MDTLTKESRNSDTKLLFPAKTYLRWYELMLLMRRFEERAGQLYIQQKIRGFCHLYIGQESLVAGSVTAIAKTDNMITAYRDHVQPIALGVPPGIIMAELLGKSAGGSKGKGGSMHMFDKKRRFFGGHAIVGAQIPIGAGIAFAEKYKGTTNVTLCFMGDGAVRQGALHETFNMAMIWKLPVIFIIENNYYAMGTSVERTSNVSELFKLGASYNMPSHRVNGMRCEDVHTAVEKASLIARNGEGPSLLEMVTYRYKGHSMSDPATYRTKDEVEEFKAQDCILHVLNIIKSNKLCDEKALTSMDEKIKKQIDDAVQFAEAAPFPDESDLYKDVYTQQDYPFLE